MFLEAIATYLTTQGIVGGATGWELFEAFVPPDPDKIVVLTPTGGSGPDNQGDSQLVGVVTFQAFVRGGNLKEDSGYVDARLKIKEVFDELNKSQITGFNDLFALQSRGIFIGFDENKRPMFTMNFSGRFNL